MLVLGGGGFFVCAKNPFLLWKGFTDIYIILQCQHFFRYFCFLHFLNIAS